MQLLSWTELPRTMLASVAVAGALWLYRPRTKDISQDAKDRLSVLTDPQKRHLLASLEELDLRGCDLTVLPETIGLCTKLRKLDLGGNPRLTTLPDNLALCTSLEILFILGCRKMTQVPAVLGQMESLTRLGLRSNGITTIAPGSLPPNVVHLILTDNQLTTLDVRVFEQLTKVRKLMIANNQLTSLPAAGVALMQELELVRLANNQLTSIPSELLSLPKLAWFAAAGNPCMPAAPAASIPTISSTDYELDLLSAPLGEGASGKVLCGTYLDKPVAVKSFKAVTSDGKADDEAAIQAALGESNEHIIAAKAIVAASASDGMKVIMERLPASLLDLALPPTIIEVTADRYLTPGLDGAIPEDLALRILAGVADALAYLHQDTVRIAHGDVYGHNILVALDGSALKLGDFGAAFAYPAGSDGAVEAALVQRVEVRAFGVLTLELVQRTSRFEPTAGFEEALTTLGNRCVCAEVRSRPSFAEVVDVLKELDYKLCVMDFEANDRGWGVLARGSAAALDQLDHGK